MVRFLVKTSRLETYHELGMYTALLSVVVWRIRA